MVGICGIVLAAGAGSRAGGPKALRRMPEGTPWLVRSTTVLLEAGCGRVVVVLGALADSARALVPADPRVEVVVAEHWAEGMSASLRAGLAVADGTGVLVTLVDLPDLPATVARRVLGDAGSAESALSQAVFAGRPGHPVFIGRDHWAAVAEWVSGDAGARAYLVAHGVREVECGDLAGGGDRDEGY